MKAKLIYDEEEEPKALLRAVKSLDVVLVLWDIDQYLRGEAKYNDNEEAQKIRDAMYDIMDSHGVVLNDLVE
jgi:hypothetical protein